MNARPIVGLADRAATLPGTTGERADASGVALTALASEERRLTRLGLEPALTRCRTERRYWEFVHALMSVARADRQPALPESW